MLIRIDARRLTDAATLHDVLNEAFGFTAGYGKNFDALVDCLTHLDDPTAALSRVQLFPGQIALVVIEHTVGRDKRTSNQVKALSDAIAFVNWRRLEMRQPPVVAMAYENG
jgi:RNAse (barnase) inhibitor barstar